MRQNHTSCKAGERESHRIAKIRGTPNKFFDDHEGFAIERMRKNCLYEVELL